jgi:NAD(P)-dependent dehydrogenase (short-subunit alcohol dehydrogenase family)
MGSEPWDTSRMPSLAGRVAVVTGANSGIGFVTALELARKHARVVLACRNAQRAQQALDAIKTELAPASVTVEFLLLDLSELESVRLFAEAFRARFERLDLLVNNGGVMVPTPTHTPDGLEMQFAVNHLGHFYLTHLLFDLLVAGDAPSRVVNVSSVSHGWVAMDLATLARSRPGKKVYTKEYGTSKLANLLFTYELARRVEAAGLSDRVVVVAAHPGITTSDIAPKMFATYLPEWTLGFMNKLLKLLHIMQATDRGALPSLFAATDASVESGDFFGPDGLLGIRGKGPVRVQSSSASHSEEDAAALWALSEDLTQCKFEVSR